MMKKICFAHNVYDRKDLLLENISKNLSFFPNSEIIISTNNPNINFNEPYIKYFYFGENQGHALGALNSMLLVMNKAIELDSEIIVFSHDDLYINNIDLFNKSIEILNNKEMVIRRFTGDSDKKHEWEKYFMFDCFIITKQFAQKVFSKIDIITNKYSLPRDYRCGPCPEIYFGKLISSFIDISNIDIVDYPHCTWYDTELGFYHYPSNDTEYKNKWNKENIEELLRR